MAQRRYAIDPLVAALRATSMTNAARELGVSGSTIRRYLSDGIARDTAERYASRAGFHPYEVWPEMISDDLADADIAERQQHERTKAVQRKAWRKKWDRMSEEQKEAKRNYVREYRTQARGAIRAHRRRYYQENRERELARQRDYDARKRAERKAS